MWMRWSAVSTAAECRNQCSLLWDGCRCEFEGAFFRLNSFAVSLEYDSHADFATAALIACSLIRQILLHQESSPQLYNINIPTAP